MNDWNDLNARARGLATHLLGEETLDALERAPSLTAIAEVLSHHGYPLSEPHEHATAAGLDLAARRAAAHSLTLLARWAGEERREILAVVFEHEDLMSLRRICRGLAAALPAEQRLAGCLPTPLLPEKALEELSRQASFAAMGARLAVWENPYAEALAAADESHRPTPMGTDLARLELALAETYARRAAEGARRRDRALAFFVERSIDLENLRSVLLLTGSAQLEVASEGEASGAAASEAAARSFLEGGRLLSQALFMEAVSLRREEAVARLETALSGSLFAGLVTLPPTRFDEKAMGRLAAQLRQLARLDPWTSAPVLAYLLARWRELYRVTHAVWQQALSHPLESSHAPSSRQGTSQAGTSQAGTLRAEAS